MQIKPKKQWLLVWNINNKKIAFMGKSPKVMAIGGAHSYFEAKTKTELEDKIKELGVNHGNKSN